MAATKTFKPLVIESYIDIHYQNKTYKRRLRISGYNACLIDEKLGTGLYRSGSIRFT